MTEDRDDVQAQAHETEVSAEAADDEKRVVEAAPERPAPPSPAPAATAARPDRTGRIVATIAVLVIAVLILVWLLWRKGKALELAMRGAPAPATPPLPAGGGE